MKISFSTLGCPEWSLNEILSTAKDLGYDGIEVRGVGKELYSPKIKDFSFDNIEHTKQHLNSIGLVICCLTSACYLHLSDNAMIKEAYDYIDLANALNVPYVRVLGDTDPAPSEHVDDELVFNQLKHVCEYAKDSNVLPLIETNGVYANTKRLHNLIKDIDNVGVIWDVHHPYRFFHETPEKTIANLGSSIKHVHLKDSIYSHGRVRYQMLSYGDIPVTEAITLLNETEFDGFYSLEWVRRWDLSLEDAGIAFAHFATFMQGLK